MRSVRPVTLVTGGSIGDVQPLVAIGRGLRAAGFPVRVAGQRAFQALALDAGLSFADLQSSDPGETKAKEVLRPAGRLRTLARTFTREGPDPALLKLLYEQCQGSAAIVFTSISGLAYHVAEALRIPSFYASLHPIYPTCEFASPFVPAELVGRRLPPPVNWASHLALHQLYWQVDRPWVNRWRRSMGLPPASRRSFFHLMRGGGTRFLFGFSPAIVPAPADWPANFEVTGYWLDPERPFLPPAALEAFLEEGEPPIFVGFGSTFDRNPNELAQVVTSALGTTGVRAVVGRGLQGADNIGHRGRVFHADYVPYSWLYPRVRLAVHHAGAGTCAEALRAGVPSIGVPFFAEQRFWAHRLAEAGVATKPLARADITASSLARCIEDAARDDVMLHRSRELARVVASEDGVGAAVRAIQERIGPSPVLATGR